MQARLQAKAAYLGPVSKLGVSKLVSTETRTFEPVRKVWCAGWCAAKLHFLGVDADCKGGVEVGTQDPVRTESAISECVLWLAWCWLVPWLVGKRHQQGTYLTAHLTRFGPVKRVVLSTGASPLPLRLTPWLTRFVGALTKRRLLWPPSCGPVQGGKIGARRSCTGGGPPLCGLFFWDWLGLQTGLHVLAVNRGL